MDEVPEVEPVLLGERLVEAVLDLRGLDEIRIRARPGPELHGGRVAGNEVREPPRDDGDAGEEQDHGEKPPPEEAEEAAGRKEADVARRTPGHTAVSAFGHGGQVSVSGR